MKEILLKSPAKVNLFLEVLGKRPDGFHQIETLFQAINLCDIIHIKKARKDGIFISTDCKELPVDKNNLAYQAADLLKRKYRLGGIKINIEKKIPLSGGLGGGSSNAAAVLRGINKLWNLGLSKEELCKFADKLGSDTAFFLSGYKTALGGGRGEILEQVEIPRYWFLLIFPEFGVSTKDAYNNLQLGLTRKYKNAKMLLRVLEKKDITQIGKKLYNILEKPVFDKFPLLKKIKQKLKTAGQSAVLMSGSGSTIFLLSATRKGAVEARERVKSFGWQMKVVGSF